MMPYYKVISSDDAKKDNAYLFLNLRKKILNVFNLKHKIWYP